ncbi:hypothetical protein AB0O47_39240 [Streptomyces noursei]|uniref:hypothetical protein n=1 Tax=Streptomyces noursei TaxID=1971 RepID=UPI003450D588
MNPLDSLPRPPTDPTFIVVILIVLGVLAALAVPAFKGFKRTVRFLHAKVTLAVGFGFTAAIACTIFSADSSWRFAAKMGLERQERLLLFGVAEIAVLALVFMARQNLNGEAKTPGVPGTLVKVVVGVQIIPAFDVSGTFLVGVVRAFFGPLMAMLMWHLMLDIELSHKDPTAESNALVSQLAREARTRIFAYLGLAQRNKTAIDIVRDRHFERAVALYFELNIMENDSSVKMSARSRAKKYKKAAKRMNLGCGNDLKRKRELDDRVGTMVTAAELAKKKYRSKWNTTEIEDPVANALIQHINMTVNESVDRAVATATATHLAVGELATAAGGEPEPTDEQLRRRLKKNNKNNATFYADEPRGPVLFANVVPLRDPSEPAERQPRPELETAQPQEQPHQVAAEQLHDVAPVQPEAAPNPEPEPDPEPPRKSEPKPEATPVTQGAPRVLVKEPEPERERAARPGLVPARARVEEPAAAEEDAAGDVVGVDGLPSLEGLKGRARNAAEREHARAVYRRSVLAGAPMEAEKLVEPYGKSTRWGEYRIAEEVEAMEKEQKRSEKGGLRVVAGK